MVEAAVRFLYKKCIVFAQTFPLIITESYVWVSEWLGDNKELCIPDVNDMASNALPVPPPLEIHYSNAADKWRKFLAAWENYALATELGGKPQTVQVTTLLTVIGEDGREVYSTFRDWAQDGDDRRIMPVLRKFAEYCQPRKNVPFERYKLNKRTQESGESYEQYKTTLRKLYEACEFETITPNEIMRDRLIFGIRMTLKFVKGYCARPI